MKVLLWPFSPMCIECNHTLVIEGPLQNKKYVFLFCGNAACKNHKRRAILDGVEMECVEVEKRP